MPAGSINVNNEVDLCIAALHALKVIWTGHGYSSPASLQPVSDLADMLEQGAPQGQRSIRRVIASALRANFASLAGATPPGP
jgi:hypothetical protein